MTVPATNARPKPTWASLFSGLQDLTPDNFPTTDWEASKAVQALEDLRRYATGEARQAETWYLHKRGWKRRAGQVTRLAAMLAVACAGVLPVVAQILGRDGQFAVHPAWATVLLAAAALLVSLDYFFSFTSGWIRYLEAQQKIARALYEFQFDWESLRAGWAGRQPAPEQVNAALGRLKEMILRVQQVVEDETAAWAAEFRSTLQRLDEAARARAEAARAAPGATVTITNPAAAASEWTLAVDDGAPTKHRGSRAALVGLRPGPHKLVAEGQVDGRSARDEVTVEFPPSGVAEVSLTLR
jgi:hypothetical protein